ncbi:porin [Candidatus Auribacterota bacterium]
MGRVVCFVIAVMFIAGIQTLARASEIDILVKKLVVKRILTEQEAREVLDETRKEVAKQKQQEKQEIVETAKEEASKQLKDEVSEAVAVAKLRTPPENSFDVYWKDGVHFDTADKKFRLKIGGRIQADTAWMKQQTALKDLVGKKEHSAEFRRARLCVKGTIYDNFFFEAQYDFAGGGNAEFKNVYMGLKGIPYLGRLKIGHYKEPFSLEELTSSNFITFMERSLPNAFAPQRNMGIQLNNTLFDKRVTWAAGVFRPSDDFGFSGSGWAATGRLTGLPIYEDKGKKLLHLGAAYSFRDPRGTLRYRERPECHLAPRFVNTDSFDTDYASLFGIEAALVYGSLSIQSELIQSFVDQSHSNSSHTYFPGVYVYGSYFITGEHREYKKSSGKFTRVRPKKNFSIKDRTFGALEAAVRYSYLDLDDKNIDGGIVSDVTVGLNWYLNPNMRLMGNYIHSNRNSVGSADILEGRCQIDF